MLYGSVPGLPLFFRHSSASVYYTEPLANRRIKNRGGLGMRLAIWPSCTRITMHIGAYLLSYISLVFFKPSTIAPCGQEVTVFILIQLLAEEIQLLGFQ